MRDGWGRFGWFPQRKTIPHGLSAQKVVFHKPPGWRAPASDAGRIFFEALAAQPRRRPKL